MRVTFVQLRQATRSVNGLIGQGNTRLQPMAGGLLNTSRHSAVQRHQ
jgi:hypothetical protein